MNKKKDTKEECLPERPCLPCYLDDGVCEGAQPAPAVVEPVALAGWNLVPVEPTPEMIAAMALIEASGQVNGVATVGMAGAEDAHAAMIEAAPQPQQIAEPASQAAKDVLAERERQISVEGWTPKHDDEHDSGQLAGAAACYARHINARSWVVADLDEGLEVYRTEPAQDYWPWDESWWKPTTPRRDAVKACALLLAEIERIDRATTPKEPS